MGQTAERRRMVTVLQCQAAPLVRDPLTADQATSLAVVFKALSDPVRLRLLSLIASHDGGEACVCDLTPAFEVSEPTISHHLKVLRDTGLVTSQRRASWVYYRLVPEALTGLSALLATGSTGSTGATRATDVVGAGR
jgi:ArsR family transcriptional regulator, arsenate/arsenite/antimonite-responsive transcriptional repressor